MNDEARVLAAVRCACPGESVVRIQGFDRVFVMTLSDESRKVVFLPAGLDAESAPYRPWGFELVHLQERESQHCRACVALFDDGEAYLLGDREQLSRFYQRIAPSFPPLRLPHLLTWHASTRGGVVLQRTTDLDVYELEPPPASLPGLTEPRVEGGALEFWSYGVDGTPVRTERVYLWRWLVTGLDGDLRWEQTPVATLRPREHAPKATM